MAGSSKLRGEVPPTSSFGSSAPCFSSSAQARPRKPGTGSSNAGHLLQTNETQGESASSQHAWRPVVLKALSQCLSRDDRQPRGALLQRTSEFSFGKLRSRLVVLKRESQEGSKQQSPDEVQPRQTHVSKQLRFALLSSRLRDINPALIAEPRTPSVPG